MLHVLNSISLLTFLGVDTYVPVALLQLFKVCKVSESFYPPDLNGSKMFYCIKTLNLPHLWIMKTFTLWQIYRLERLF